MEDKNGVAIIWRWCGTVAYAENSPRGFRLYTYIGLEQLQEMNQNTPKINLGGLVKKHLQVTVSLNHSIFDSP
jgi:hypothetical protein